ncbi:DUF6404 family protein [Janthinobacterium sp. 75]|uniref:DUF6404 family protein n=1 Tax=Janthinobacterium sp. 75 TaxID=2135628 RepID=UPI001062E99E|nr:DUF6404 family protein [Janthinobacterium sp. 75]TDY33287.1 hypothetical protein C8C89_1060 [Janthinobacterium sp. 75]
MSFEYRKTRALELLHSTGMARSHYAPPLMRLLWKVGVQVPPPHFQSFLRAALGMGLWFGTCWGVVMWIFFWWRSDAATPLSPLAALVAASAAGLLFGLAMASFYARDRRKHQLPAWTELDAQ